MPRARTKYKGLMPGVPPPNGKTVKYGQDNFPRLEHPVQDDLSSEIARAAAARDKFRL